MEYTIQFTAVAGTLGLLWLTLMGLRRLRGPENPRTRLQVRQRVSVANGCQLVVVEWDGRELLLATGTQSCSVVASKATLATETPAEVSGAWAL
ncbi:MAG: flagellar biosynthetic protein FliO [Acidobacteria bacterium]|nr:flagellar biosynthetic protein FliO [Acidobacteriota bacterium]